MADRLREAITIANNEIYRLASTRLEWRGMACVLTAAVVEGDRAVIGHVGDSRLYKLQGSQIEKMTPDHSPVGEREDAKAQERCPHCGKLVHGEEGSVSVAVTGPLQRPERNANDRIRETGPR